ncbi:MAG: hypothetical protein M3N93_04145, partial [Acidobacteriota bacterium]|nr:hypothetical protein [Acidobacteriota bacterium]
MPNSRYFILLLTAVTVGSVGCSKTQDAPSSAADGNLAPVSDTGQYPNQASNQAPVRTTAPAPNYRSTAAPAYPNYQDYPDNSYSDQPDYSGQLVYASQPPPPLPEYSQPPCPGDNYIWTPGNWNYGNAGYYWVPGAWVLAPYVDALWTPPYWEYSGDRYRWHRGYWGRHIGFYGGIDYGFGYTGRGYYGGYWNGGRFNYNRSVTNVNVNIVQNVYERNVSVGRVSRVSFNGPGGINVRPIPAEIAVLHEARTAPIPAQIQHARAAQENRSQFAAVNRGQPAIIAQAQPLGTNYRAPSDRPAAAEQLRPLPAQPPGRPPVPEQRAAAPGQFAPPDQRPGERPTRLQIDGPRNQP